MVILLFLGAVVAQLLCFSVFSYSPHKKSLSENNFACFSNVMENYLKLLMDTVDDLSQDTNKYHNYQKMYGKQQQAKEAQLTKRVSSHSLLVRSG
mgnify:CR=1 FL=1